MYIAYNEEQEALREELRAYYENLLTPEIREGLAEGHGTGEVMRSVVKQMAADGWLGIGWPKEYGGQGRSQIEQFIFFDESMRSMAPVPMLTINTVGPTIVKHGSQEQKDFFLPKILKGEIHFCIGYTEPSAGTDLASLQTRAVKDGDEYVINGQKIFTSLASDADYIWLATRTDPDAAKHAGITMFIADMDTPGVKAEPMDLLSSHNICSTYFDDVRVPESRMVGGLNKGWKLITGQLNHERVTICSCGMLENSYEDVLAWARETRLADGRRVIDQEWAQINLARVHAGLEFLRLINWKVAWSGIQGKLDVSDASTTKIFGTEFYLQAFRLMMEVLGPRAYVKKGSPADLLAGRLEMMYRSLIILTYGGGTNEIQRDLIGMFGLGLPRAPRF
jgi:alkylation response protein AidB-like acyl-CoA dehydrogenase